MMRVTKMLQQGPIVYSIPLLIIGIAIAITLSPFLHQYPNIAIGITYDLVFTAPLAYLLIIRKRKVPKITVAPVIVLGIVIASFILPEQQQGHLNAIKTYLLPLVELIVFSILISKIYRGIRTFQSESKHLSDFYAISKASAKSLFEKKGFASFFASEISMFYYGLCAWRFKKLQKNQFSSYKESASIAMAGALLLVVFIETFTFHVLLVKWSVVAAWIFTGTSIYTALVIIAHIKAVLLRPALLTKDSLILKNGLIADIHIPLNQINKVDLCSSEKQSSAIRIGNLGLSKESTSHNLILYFKNPQTIEKMYGFTETCDALLFHIDGKEAFVKRLQSALPEK